MGYSEVVPLLAAHVPSVQVELGSESEPYLPFEDAAADERIVASLLGHPDRFEERLTPKARGAHAVAILSFQLAKVLAILALANKCEPPLDTYVASIEWRNCNSADGPHIKLHLAMLIPIVEPSNAALILNGWMQPFVFSIAETTGLEPTMQWRLVADSVALAFQQMGDAVGREYEGRKAGLAIVRDERALFHSLDTDFICMSRSGSEQDRYFLRRAGCCLAYQAPGGTVCDNCGLFPTAVQKKRLAAFVDALPPA